MEQNGSTSDGSRRRRRRRSAKGGNKPQGVKAGKKSATPAQRIPGPRTRSQRTPGPRPTSPPRRPARVEEELDLPTSVETSAGGLVLSGLAEAVRPDGSVDLSAIYVALIGRLDRRGRLLWSMPKGHVEPNESQHATAEREVWEETGIAGTVIGDLGTIDYWFVSDGVRIHKTVHHHLLRYVDGDLNDEDPEVTEVHWLPVDQLVERLAYADERRLAHLAFDSLPNYARAEAAAGRFTPR